MTLIHIDEDPEEAAYSEGFVAGMNIGHGLANLRAQAERAKWQAKLRRLREKMRRKAYRNRMLATGSWPEPWNLYDEERLARHAHNHEYGHTLRHTVRIGTETLQARHMRYAKRFPIAGPKGKLP